MGLVVDKSEAAERFNEALELARSNTELPEVWADHTARLHVARARTFTPMLGTALLAKATNRYVSAFALQESEGHKGYSARGLAKDVLVPLCVLSNIDLRTTGAEPLNNSPFFREKRVGSHLGVSERDRPALDALLRALADADFLEGRDAIEALAAFLRARIALGEPPRFIDVGDAMVGVEKLGSITTRFITSETEGGRRGQAFTAASFDLVFNDVRVGRINDPSATAPGDVLVADVDGMIILSGETKQKSVTAAEILQFVSRLASAGIARGVYAAFDPRQAELPTELLAGRALQDFGVLLTVISEPHELLDTALAWSSRSLAHNLRHFPGAMGMRLTEFGCAASTSKAWADLLAEQSDSEAPR